MSFPVDVTSVLTGATVGQLQYWRRTDRPLLTPEVQQRPVALYSFRDLLALRTVVKLRRETSLQAVRAAFKQLADMELTDHPSRYRLVSQGSSIVLIDDDGRGIDLVAQPGHETIATLEDILQPFTTKSGRDVADFRHPRPHLEVREGRIGGWPTIAATRIPYDQVASLVAGGDITPEQVPLFYPTVRPEAVADAVDFEAEVRSVRSAA